MCVRHTSSSLLSSVSCNAPFAAGPEVLDNARSADRHAPSMVVVEMPALSRFWFTFGAARRDKPFKTSYVGYKLTSCGRSPFRSIMLICALAAIGWPSMLSCARELEPGGRKIHWMAPYLDL